VLVIPSEIALTIRHLQIEVRGIIIEETMEITKTIQEIKQTVLDLKLTDKVQDHQIHKLEDQLKVLEGEIQDREETAQIQITHLRGEVARLGRL
jgi:hypothetical protein